MNTTGFLLGMMTIMVLIAFITSFGGIQFGNNNQPNEEREKLRSEIAELQQESAKLRLQAALQRAPLPYNSPAPYVAPTNTSTISTSPPAVEKPLTQELSSEIDELKKQLAEQEETNAALEETNEKVERQKNVAEKEASMAWSERTKVQQKQERERRRIEIALTMGTVQAVNSEYGFLTFRPSPNQQFSRGQTLGIRRNSGVLGQIIIDREQEGDYIANIKPNAYAGGIPPIQEGDEVIVLPESYFNPADEASTGTSGGSNQSLRELLPE